MTNKKRTLEIEIAASFGLTWGESIKALVKEGVINAEDKVLVNDEGDGIVTMHFMKTAPKPISFADIYYLYFHPTKGLMRVVANADYDYADFIAGENAFKQTQENLQIKYPRIPVPETSNLLGSVPAKILALKKQGWVNSAIAKSLGVTQQTVYNTAGANRSREVGRKPIVQYDSNSSRYYRSDTWRGSTGKIDLSFWRSSKTKKWHLWLGYFSPEFTRIWDTINAKEDAEKERRNAKDRDAL